MNVKKATSQIRKEHWKKVISDRNESGLTVKKYCSQYSINEATYYYWLKKIRREALEELNDQPEETNAIVPMLKTLTENKKVNHQRCNQSASDHAGMTITTNVMRIEFATNTSSELVLQIVKELNNA